MVTLTETTEIAAPFEKLEWWVDHFEEEFVKWSPLHLECELLSGGIQAGDKVRFHEIVMGMDYDVTGTIIRAERDRDHFSFALGQFTRNYTQTTKRGLLTTNKG